MRDRDLVRYLRAGPTILGINDRHHDYPGVAVPDETPRFGGPDVYRVTYPTDRQSFGGDCEQRAKPSFASIQLRRPCLAMSVSESFSKPSLAMPAGSFGRIMIGVSHLFVYGTLRLGDVRWRFLEPFVVDEGWPDTIDGRLFDTGLDYPAAVLDDRAEPGGTITGHTYALLDSAIARCLEVLDAEEGTVDGQYRRVVVPTGRGIAAYAYEYGTGLDLQPIESGDWFESNGRR